MNTTVARLTARSLLGGRRAILLVVLPVVLIGLAALGQALTGEGAELAPHILGVFALGTLLPLLALIAGTGAIGPEIDDGSIMYLLAKPIPRSSIVLAKLAVASVVVLVFGALPVVITSLVLTGDVSDYTVAYGLAAAVASVAYATVFLLLAIVSRNAVVIGLLYAVVWETLVGQIVPGAQALSIQQWSLATATKLLPVDSRHAGIDPAVGGVGIVLLIAVVVGGAWLATHKLRTVRITGES